MLWPPAEAGGLNGLSGETAMAYESRGPDVKISDPTSTANNMPGATRDAGQAAADLGRSAARKADRARTRAAAGLEHAAKYVHSGADRMASAGHGAGDALSSGARYVREHDARDIGHEVMAAVRRNPGVALLGAAALGFLVGRVVTRH
jgi:hypothetical protein